MISPFYGGVVWILKEAEVLTSLSLSATLLALTIVAHLCSTSIYRIVHCTLLLPMAATDATSIHVDEQDLLSPSQYLDPQAGSRHQSKAKNELLRFKLNPT